MVENELNKLSEKVELISTKWLTKDLINEHSILNSSKYFIEYRAQNCFVFQTILKYFQASKIAEDSKAIV